MSRPDLSIGGGSKVGPQITTGDLLHLDGEDHS